MHEHQSLEGAGKYFKYTLCCLAADYLYTNIPSIHITCTHSFTYCSKMLPQVVKCLYTAFLNSVLRINVYRPYLKLMHVFKDYITPCFPVWVVAGHAVCHGVGMIHYTPPTLEVCIAADSAHIRREMGGSLCGTTSAGSQKSLSLKLC